MSAKVFACCAEQHQAQEQYAKMRFAPCPQSVVAYQTSQHILSDVADYGVAAVFRATERRHLALQPMCILAPEPRVTPSQGRQAWLQTRLHQVATP